MITNNYILKKLNIYFIIISFFLSGISLAQSQEAKKEKVFKNTISYNLTNTLIFGGKSQVLCYERTTGEHQSFTIEVGTFSFPKITILPGTYRSNSESSQAGYKFAADYRF